MSLLFFDKFVYSRCLFTKPTKEDNIYHSTMLNNGAPVFIQLPKLKTINGIHWHDNRCYLDLELTKAVLDFFLHFEQENIQTAFKNSEKWFGKEMPLDIIESNYLSIIKLDSNKSYIRFSIPVVNNKECGIHVYNQFKERINTDNIIPKTNVGVILKCNGLVMGKRKLCFDWQIEQIKYNTQSKPENSYMFLEDETEDMEIMENSPFEDEKYFEDYING